MGAGEIFGGMLLLLLAILLVAAFVGRCAGANDPTAPVVGAHAPPKTLTCVECMTLPVTALRRLAFLTNELIHGRLYQDNALSELEARMALSSRAASDVEVAEAGGVPPPPVGTWGQHLKKKAATGEPTSKSPLAPKGHSPKGHSPRGHSLAAKPAAAEPPPPPPADGTDDGTLGTRGRTASADRTPKATPGKKPAAAKKPPTKKPPPSRGGTPGSVSSDDSKGFRDTATTRARNKAAREVPKPWEKKNKA